MFRLLAIDLDGTLLNSQHQISPRTYQAVLAAIQAGITVVIATGQILPYLRHVTRGLPLDAPQIIYNGAIIANSMTGTVLHERLLPEKDILPALDALRDLDLYRAYHTYQHVYVDNGTPNAMSWYPTPIPQPLEQDDVASLYPQHCIKVVGIGDPATLRQKREVLEQRFAGKLYVTQTAPFLLEMLHPAVSKDSALRQIARDLGIVPAEIMAFGDNHNDIGMLQFAGMGIAMGNAHAEVKQAASYVTLSNNQDGIAAVIEEKILSRRTT